MEKYSSYKDSGVHWLGEIPSHWSLRKMKYTFVERSQKGFPKEPLLAATQSYGVIKKEDYEVRTVEALKNLETLKLVEIGDFVISLRSFQVVSNTHIAEVLLALHIQFLHLPILQQIILSFLVSLQFL